MGTRSLFSGDQSPDWLREERAVAEAYKELAFVEDAIVTQRTCDGGKDVIVITEDGQRWCEVKSWEKPVDSSQLKEFVESVDVSGQDIELDFHSSSGFTEPAKEFADNHSVHLSEGDLHSRGGLVDDLKRSASSSAEQVAERLDQFDQTAVDSDFVDTMTEAAASEKETAADATQDGATSSPIASNETEDGTSLVDRLLNTIQSVLEDPARIKNILAKGWDSFKGLLGRVKDVAKAMLDKANSFLSHFAEIITEGISNTIAPFLEETVFSFVSDASRRRALSLSLAWLLAAAALVGTGVLAYRIYDYMTADDAPGPKERFLENGFLA